MDINDNKPISKAQGDEGHCSSIGVSLKREFLGKKKFDEYKYGNYKNYYTKRLGPGEEKTDLRLSLLEEHPECFRNKKVLDIGCNSGFVTINFAKQLLPKSVLGIDIDGTLIEKARRDLNRERVEPEVTDEELVALNSVSFRKANYILKDSSLLQLEKPQYDAILCLSITKWIHLNFGDDGIKFLFQRIYKQLNPNGILILEAQPFSTYKKRSRLSPEIQHNYKAIQLLPQHFEAFLMSEQVGFDESWCIADKDIMEKETKLAKGFQRPLQVFVKR